MRGFRFDGLMPVRAQNGDNEPRTHTLIEPPRKPIVEAMDQQKQWRQSLFQRFLVLEKPQPVHQPPGKPLPAEFYGEKGE